MKARRKPVSVSSDLPKCPIAGCTARRKKDHLMCSGHWGQVPSERQKEALRLYKTERGSTAHWTYVAQLIKDMGGAS